MVIFLLIVLIIATILVIRATNKADAEAEAKTQLHQSEPIRKYQKGKTCAVCGEYSGTYTLCKNCYRLKNTGKIEKCKECNTWHQISAPCKCTSSTISDSSLIAQFEKQYIQLKFENELLKTKNKELEKTLQEKQDFFEKSECLIKQYTSNFDYRKKYPTPYRCADGDWVRSKAEREIDNFFYTNRIWHIYESEYIVSENCTYYPDFYLPDYNLYIEYFGCDDENYIEAKNKKIDVYSHDPGIKFAYITYEDDARIEEKLNEICRTNWIKLKR